MSAPFKLSYDEFKVTKCCTKTFVFVECYVVKLLSGVVWPLRFGIIYKLFIRACLHLSISQQSYYLFSIFYNLRNTSLFLAGMVNKQEMVEKLNKTCLKLTYKVKTFLHWLQANNIRCRKIILVSGLRFLCQIG